MGEGAYSFLPQLCGLLWGLCLALPCGGSRPWAAEGCSRDGQGSAGTELKQGLCLLLTVSLWAGYLTSLSFRRSLGRVGKMIPASKCCCEISSGKCLVHRAASSPALPPCASGRLAQDSTLGTLQSGGLYLLLPLCPPCFASGLYLVEAQ